MIQGIGTDIVDLDRITKVFDQFGDKFVRRILHADEIALYQRRNSTINFLAGRFAAKEAIVKAIGSGLRGFSWTDINIRTSELGAPIVEFNGSCALACGERGVAEVKVSISHERRWAVAMAIALQSAA
ncbi:MAG: holo-ACP synthase [Gammaproteobacteria bacterium]|nr:holo-ACP synthase [Gammaproteobacteria bacterium]